MNRREPLSMPSRQQSGFVLIVALVLLLILTLIGIAAAQRTTLEQKMATNAQSRDMAFQAAEAALRAAEGGTEQGLWNGFINNANGQYLFDPTGSVTPQWELGNSSVTPGTVAVNIPFLTNSANMLNYQTVTGNTISGVVNQPVFMIEQMPPVPAPGQSLALQQYGSGVPQIQVYRITALGWGGDSTSIVVLQSTYRP